MKNEKTNYYSYSSAENNEIRKIREKYENKDKEESKIEKLRRLDKSVNSIATSVSVAVGIIGVLVLGFGMSCVLVWMDSMFAVGIVSGIIGMVIIILAHPVYKFVAEKRKKRITPEILSLTDELMK